MRHHPRYLLALLLLATVLSAPLSASADNARINVEVFRPAAHTGDFITSESTLIPGHLQWNVGLWTHYGKNPFVYRDTTNTTPRRHALIANQLAVDLVGSVALYDWVDVGIGLPLFLVNTGDAEGFAKPANPISSTVLGDLRFTPKIRLLKRQGLSNNEGFGLALSVEANLPTGDANSFVSDGFAVQPMLLMDFVQGPLTVALNVGGRLREESCHHFLCVAHQGIVKGAVQWQLLPELRVTGELNSALGLNANGLDQNSTYLEGVMAASYVLPSEGWAFTLGGGSGLLPGYGDTKFRLFAGIGYTPATNVDMDADGVTDDADKCPKRAEDLDGFEDADGCPELDNDQDGLEDNVDKCPNDPEDIDGYRDADGCPDLDNDGDGLTDEKDRCPNKAEDVDGFEDDDGCPDDDNDGDGITDKRDRCPNKPETKNFYQDDDGCPDKTLARLEEGRIVITDKIYFDSGKATIKPYSYAILRAVAGILQTHPAIQQLSIEGHTDDRGGRKYNLELSQRRAEAVRTFIIEEGVGKDRLVATGHGKERPASEGRGPDARDANRRVEFLRIAK